MGVPRSLAVLSLSRETHVCTKFAKEASVAEVQAIDDVLRKLSDSASDTAQRHQGDLSDHGEQRGVKKFSSMSFDSLCDFIAQAGDELRRACRERAW